MFQIVGVSPLVRSLTLGAIQATKQRQHRLESDPCISMLWSETLKIAEQIMHEREALEQVARAQMIEPLRAISWVLCADFGRLLGPSYAGDTSLY